MNTDETQPQPTRNRTVATIRETLTVNSYFKVSQPIEHGSGGGSSFYPSPHRAGYKAPRYQVFTFSLTHAPSALAAYEAARAYQRELGGTLSVWKKPAFAGPWTTVEIVGLAVWSVS